MNKDRTASPVSIILALALSITACSGSGGGGDPTSPRSAGSPQVIITSPDATEIDTTDDTMSLAGTASSAAGVRSVSWKTGQGQSGTASGTQSWSVEQIPLALGVNTITVTLTDAAGATHSDTIVINRESKGKGSVTLSWVAPTERTDGTALTDLAGYRIHYGRMSGVYDYEVEIDTPGILTYVVENLVPGNWYFSVTAYDTSGIESDFSNEAERHVR